jgi:PEP-CTERM motif
MTKIFSVAGLAGLLLSAGLAQAVPIAGLVNTGAGPAFVADAIDTNYAFAVVVNSGSNAATGIACASTSGLCGAVARDPSFPVDAPWLATAASPTSTWLTPSTTQAQSYDAFAQSTYTWTLTFDLTGFDPNTAAFTARFAGDNDSVATLNGTQIGVTASGPGINSFNTWANFSSGGATFLGGVNTLTFTVVNLPQETGNPTGIRVEFLSSTVTAVPEPQTYALLLAGLAAVGFVAKRRNRQI